MRTYGRRARDANLARLRNHQQLASKQASVDTPENHRLLLLLRPHTNSSPKKEKKVEKRHNWCPRTGEQEGRCSCCLLFFGWSHLHPYSPSPPLCSLFGKLTYRKKLGRGKESAVSPSPLPVETLPSFFPPFRCPFSLLPPLPLQKEEVAKPQKGGSTYVEENCMISQFFTVKKERRKTTSALPQTRREMSD